MIREVSTGNCSLDASNALIKKGFKNVAHITTGFEGSLNTLKQHGNLNDWRYNSLPWEQC